MDSWIKIMMAQDKTVHTLGNPRNHCLEIKCFTHNLTELESYVTPSSGDENVGDGEIKQHKNKMYSYRNTNKYMVWPWPLATGQILRAIYNV